MVQAAQAILSLLQPAHNNKAHDRLNLSPAARADPAQGQSFDWP